MKLVWLYCGYDEGLHHSDDMRCPKGGEAPVDRFGNALRKQEWVSTTYEEELPPPKPAESAPVSIGLSPSDLASSDAGLYAPAPREDARELAERICSQFADRWNPFSYEDATAEIERYVAAKEEAMYDKWVAEVSSIRKEQKEQLAAERERAGVKQAEYELLQGAAKHWQDRAEKAEAEAKVLWETLEVVDYSLAQFVKTNPKWTLPNGVEQDPSGSHQALKMLRAALAMKAEQ